MIWQRALKYPILIVGVVLFALFLSDPNTKRWWEKSKRRFIPSTCDAIVDRTAPKSPDSWTLDCPGTQLLIITVEHDPAARSLNVLRSNMYKELANSYKKLAHISNPETMEYLKNVEIIIKHPRISVRSKTDGQAVTELLKKKDQKSIAQHLKLTVKVQENLTEQN
jgi:hypothetical protein